MTLMGHKDLKTPMRYIRGQKSPTEEKRPPVLAAVVVEIFGRGERIRTSDLSVPNRAHYQAVLRPDDPELRGGVHSRDAQTNGQATLPSP